MSKPKLENNSQSCSCGMDIERICPQCQRHCCGSCFRAPNKQVAANASPPWTADRQAQYKAWHDAVREAGKEMLPRLRSLPLSELQALIQSADPHLAQWPVYQTGDRRYAMPLWGKEGMMGAQLVALVVSGLWLFMGESEEMIGGSIVGDWEEVIKAVV